MHPYLMGHWKRERSKLKTDFYGTCTCNLLWIGLVHTVSDWDALISSSLELRGSKRAGQDF